MLVSDAAVNRLGELLTPDSPFTSDMPRSVEPVAPESAWKDERPTTDGLL